MGATHCAFFDSPIGDCAIVWGEAGIRGLMLPGADRARTLVSLRRRHPQAHEGEPTPPIAEAVRVPVIASGGVGNLEHLYEGLTAGKADAALAASIFHYREHTIREAKEYLAARGVAVRG